MSNGARGRESLLLPLAVMLIVVGGFVAWMLHLGDAAGRMVAAEDLARTALDDVLAAQRAHHEAHGRFATAQELAQAAPLARLRLQADLDDGPALVTPDYRIDVLLPVRRSPDGHVWVMPPGRATPHRALTEKHFVAVARPRDPGTSGYRVYCIDETGIVRISEGVSDERGRKRNPLPTRHLGLGPIGRSGALAWIVESELKPR